MPKSSLHTVQLALFCVLVFLIPSNLFLKFAEPSAYVHGLLVDYLLPKLYLSDLVIFGLFGWWGVEVFLHRRDYSWAALRKPLVITAVSLIALGIVQLFSPRPISSFWFWLKIVEMTLLAAWCITHRQVFHDKAAYLALSVMVIFQMVIGIQQFRTQQSVFPSYIFFGETRLTQQPAIAKESFSNQQKIQPYGTTAHPNILAGVVAIGVVISLNQMLHRATEIAQEKRSFFSFLQHHKAMMAALLFAVLIIFETSSISAAAALFLGIIVVIFTYSPAPFTTKHVRNFFFLIVGTILLTPFALLLLSKFTTMPSITRRDTLNQAAISIWQHHPLLGSGLNTFTAVLEDTMPPQLLAQTSGARFIQPAHHVGLLMLAETGILGIALLILNAFVWLNHLQINQQTTAILLMTFLPFLPLLVLDHYLLTQQTGQLIFVIGWSWLYFEINSAAGVVP